MNPFRRGRVDSLEQVPFRTSLENSSLAFLVLWGQTPPPGGAHPAFLRCVFPWGQLRARPAPPRLQKTSLVPLMGAGGARLGAERACSWMQSQCPTVVQCRRAWTCTPSYIKRKPLKIRLFRTFDSHRNMTSLGTALC